MHNIHSFGRPQEAGIDSGSARFARGQEFKQSQTRELPLNGIEESVSSPNDYSKLREAALHGTPQQKIQFLTNELFIPTNDFTYVSDTIAARMQHARLFDNPGGMRINGSSGSGKDAIIRYLCRTHPTVYVGNNRICPLVAVTFDSHLAPTEILMSMHKQLGSAYRKSQSIVCLEDNLDAAMKACQTQGIIFNEAQHIVRVNKDNSRAEVRLAGKTGDWLKRFLDKIPLPFFFFGIPGWDAVFDADEQLGTRIPNTHSLGNLDSHTFVGVLDAFDEAIPLPEPAGLATPAMSNPIFATTRGNWRLLLTLLRDALLSAATANAKRIEMPDLSYAYTLSFGATGNPFGGPRKL